MQHQQQFHTKQMTKNMHSKIWRCEAIHQLAATKYHKWKKPKLRQLTHLVSVWIQCAEISEIREAQLDSNTSMW